MDHPDCQILGHAGYVVAPAFPRRGLAKAFVPFALEKKKKKGITSILIATDQDNLASRGLLEKMGGQLVALEGIDYQGQKRQSARYRLATS